VIFEPGKVTAQVYSHKVLPGINNHIPQIEKEIGAHRGILIEDNASPHTAKYTRARHAYLWFQ
jgi:hypothetical protein